MFLFYYKSNKNRLAIFLSNFSKSLNHNVKNTRKVVLNNKFDIEIINFNIIHMNNHQNFVINISIIPYKEDMCNEIFILISIVNYKCWKYNHTVPVYCISLVPCLTYSTSYLFRVSLCSASHLFHVLLYSTSHLFCILLYSASYLFYILPYSLSQDLNHFSNLRSCLNFKSCLGTNHA